MVPFQHPETQSFEAVKEVKSRSDTYYKYLINSINSQKFNNLHGDSNIPNKWGKWP